MTEKKCKSDHKVHICEMANKDKHGEIVSLVKNPHYMCMQCGRVAHLARNLCNPLALNKIPIAVAH